MNVCYVVLNLLITFCDGVCGAVTVPNYRPTTWHFMIIDEWERFGRKGPDLTEILCLHLSDSFEKTSQNFS
jgi:hypothetical protein